MADEKVCECGKAMRSKYDKCANCRRLVPRSPCITCGKPTRIGQLSCSACIADMTEDRDMPTGWIRLRPGGPLIGDQEPHNHETQCTVHAFCPNNQQMEEAA